MRQTLAGLAALLLSAALAPASASDTNAAPVRVSLANPVLMVKDLDASTRFYTEVLGYEVIGGGEITAEVSRRTVGANRNQRTRSVYLRSARLTERDLPPSGLALIHIADEDLAKLERGSDPEDAVQGEIMLSLVVEGLAEVLQRMKDGGYTILNDLQPSSSGRSMIASALDPNGIRLEMYEYVE
jgi:catechol 2,3-dioxygenase-like lactoylglutathione lyase family enzyme